MHTISGLKEETASHVSPEDPSSNLRPDSTRSKVAICARALRTLYLLAALLYTLWHLLVTPTSWTSFTTQQTSSKPASSTPSNLASSPPDSAVGVSHLEEPQVLSWTEWGQVHGVEWDRDVIEWNTPKFEDVDKNSTFMTTEDHFLSKAFGESLQPSKVIPYYYRATSDIPKKDITITTLVTSDRFKVLAALVQRYKGPISVTIHVNNNAPTRTELLESLHDLYTTSPYMSAFVDVHLVIDGFDRQFNMWRNVARYFARSDYIMMLDVDFAICTDFRERILNSPQVVSKLSEGNSAFVVPAFEFAKQSEGRNPSRFPSTKADLLQLVEQDKIGMFHKSWAPGHGSTNYTRYYGAQTGEVYKVNSYTYAYEPYVIFKKEGTPYCDERFIGYGANKAACLFELYLSGVSFYVLPDDFLIHQSHAYAEVARKNERKYNRKLYMDFREELCFRYLSNFIANGKLRTPTSKNLLAECKKIKGFSGAAGKFITANLGKIEDLGHS